MEVEDAAGRVLKEFDPKPRRHVQIDPAYRDEILEGLHEAAQSPGGTSYGDLRRLPDRSRGQDRHGGTAGHADQSWYAVLAPYPDPRIVTVVTIEEGGFGAESAAPRRCRSSKPISTSSARREVSGDRNPGSWRN